MALNLTFVDAPPPPTRSGKYSGRARIHFTEELEAELRAHPDKWALTHQAATESTRSAIAQYLKRHHLDEFALRSRNTAVDERGRRLFDIYMTYTPPARKRTRKGTK